MRTEQLFVQPGNVGTELSNGSAQHIGSGDAPDDRIAALLSEFERIEITPMSRPLAERTLDLLGRFQTCVASKMCDVTRTMSDTDSDPAEILRTRARLPRRESKRIAKVARQLSDMPKVREKFADGDITLDQATALAKAAEKVGPTWSRPIRTCWSPLTGCYRIPSSGMLGGGRSGVKTDRTRRESPGAPAASPGSEAVGGGWNRARRADGEAAATPLHPSEAGPRPSLHGTSPPRRSRWSGS